MSTAALKAAATGTTTAVAQKPKPTSFPQMLEAFKGEIARALPRHLNADTMARIALTAFRLNPKLEQCRPASVFAAVIQASQLGLRIGVNGEAYLIPYKEEAQLQIGYQGLLELVRRSGLVEQIGCYIAYERDDCRIRLGSDPDVEHTPYLDGDRGAPKVVYAVAKLKGGGKHIEYMTIDEIRRIEARSQNVINAQRYGKKTPWDTDWEEMARKTMARRICKWLPKSAELAAALELTNAADNGAQGLKIDDAIGNTFVAAPIEGEATEVTDQQQAATATTAAQPAERPTTVVAGATGQPAPDQSAWIDTFRSIDAKAQLAQAWKDCVAQYKEHSQAVPLPVEAVYNERRELLS